MANAKREREREREREKDMVKGRKIIVLHTNERERESDLRKWGVLNVWKCYMFCDSDALLV
jgi:3,4-dihydroxy-2-butanone 4-phosphate synthase